MKQILPPNVDKYISARRREKRRHQTAAFLAAVVAVGTVYSMMLPAVTMEQTAYCHVEAHTHEEECYEKRLVCGYETEQDDTAETVAVSHVHDEYCYEERQVLVCTLEETPGHVHDDSCTSVTEGLVCGLAENSGHIHTDECVQTEQKLACTDETEMHEHTDSCYETVESYICGKTEGEGAHTHTPECYGSVATYVCGMTEGEGGHAHGTECYESQRVLICELPESTEDTHVHSDECYADVLICEITEHEHTLACYSNPDADVESPSVWESTLSGVALTGTWAEDVLAIARSQLGYSESAENYIVTDSGEMKGITRYGQWYGDPYGDWCAMFVSFCLRYAQVPQSVVPTAGSCASLLSSSGSRFRSAADYTPARGDILFLDENGDGRADRAGFVNTVSDNSVQIITGDLGNSVQLTAYGIHSGAILGGSVLSADPESSDESADVSEEVTADEDTLEENTAGEEAAEDYADMLLTDETDSEPITVNPYITAASLFYRNSSAEEWTVVSEDVTISGTAELKLKVDYGKIPLSDLQSNGGLLQFTVPSLLRNPTAEGTITDEDGAVIGTVAVAGNILTIDFDDTWLQGQADAKITQINGSFYVTSGINYSGVGEDGTAELVLGEVIIKAHFEEDIVAKNGTVTLSKTVAPRIVESEDGDYAEYTLTITAGADGCPQVRVIDHFSANADYISYIGVSQTAETLTSTGSPGETVPTGKKHGTIVLNGAGDLVWQIGDMAANETRTLRYRVLLNDGYTFIQNSDSKLISNEAQSYAGSYPKDKATADLEPKAGLSLNKTAPDPVRNEDGSYTITYTVTGQANSSNQFTLENVRIADSLNNPANPTPEAVLPYVQYVEGSFLYYPQASASGTPESLTPNFNEDGKGFSVNLGSLAPGQGFCIRYQVTVPVEALTKSGGVRLDVNNRATAYADNAKKDSFDYLGFADKNSFVKYEHWAKKLVGEPISADTSVPISGSIYDATGTEPVLETTPPENFTAPSGSYLYTVLVNELGDWDVTSASMTDRIDGTYMQFVGYVKVEALDTENGNAVVNTLWVKVDGNTSFNFTMAQLGLTGNQYAYRLSYYAEPKTIEGTSAVVVNNSFTLSGTIIPGTGDPFTLTGVKVSKDVVLAGGDHLDVTKYAWYYAGPTSNAGDYKTGTIYWVIKIDGDSIKAGYRVQDYITRQSAMYFHEDSLVGIYTGSLDKTATQYENVQAVLNTGCLTEVDTSYYSTEYSNSLGLSSAFSELTIKFEHTVSLGSNSLYIFVKHSPAFIPSDYWYFYNFYKTSDDGQTWPKTGSAYKVFYDGTNLWKKVGAVFKYNGESIQETVSGQIGTIMTSALGEPGLFVSWDIMVNRGGDLSGRYRLVETLPDGMELAYVRLQQRGSNAQKACVAQISGLGGDYTAHSMPENDSYYYYTDGNTTVWDVDNLVAGKAENRYAVTFQVVCRVTDPNVLLGGETKQFNNQVTLYGEDGRQRDIDTQSVSVTTETLKKTVEQGGRTLPFTITVNSLGEDLLAGADRLTVVDTLSDTLQLDPTSITVTNSKTQDSVPYTASVDGNTLRVVIPDGQPLTISYKAKVLAKPGETVDIKNDAHWEGYASTTGGSIEIKGYNYSVGGIAGGSSTPYVEIIKYDAGSVTTRLPGAEFEMVEGTMVSGVFTPTEGKIWTGTTNAQGVLKFGEDPLMAYNMVYRITETQAPEGFVLDSTPIYFVVATNAGTEYPASVDVFYAGEDNITYVCPVGNSRGAVTVTKQFMDLGKTVEPVSGTYRFGIYDTENPAGDPMQTVSIAFEEGDSRDKTAVFKDLELDKTYYIYELNDRGKPIFNGKTATVNGQKFAVTYPNGFTVTIGGSESSTVTVTNSVSYPELPETGGSGTSLYTIGGLTLLIGAAVLLIMPHTKRRKGDPHSP